MVRAFLAAALALAAQPASAAAVFLNSSQYYFTYAEAGGTGADGAYQGNYQDLTGRSESATLPAAPLMDEVTAKASFAKGGQVLAKASATGIATADFVSASDVRMSSSGSYSAEVTAAGAVDAQVFAGAAPMYYYSFFYDFVIDTPTQMLFTTTSDTDYQGQFGLSGTQDLNAFISGTGTISQVLAPGSYAFELFIYGQAGDVLEEAGTRTGSFISDYTFKLEPTTAAVPEAATWFMLVAGIGVIGAALRRRPAAAADRARA